MRQLDMRDDPRNQMRGRTVLAGLLAANAMVWVLALGAFHARPALSGTALLAYLLGLRHAIDADHLTAIDNATRKLMHAGRATSRVGLYFSLGHSTVVILATAVLAVSSAALGRHLPLLGRIGGTVGSLISAGYLRIALRLRRGHSHDTPAPAPVGVLGRWLRPLFGLVRREWHMYPLGFLFGLGFDTATEIALLGVAVTQAAHGLALSSVMLLPLLFTAGMSLVDSGDGLLMARAYGWAMAEPVRKYSYDMSLTLASAAAALLVGAIELAGLGGNSGWAATLATRVQAHFGLFGAGITLVLLSLWMTLAWHERLRMKLRVEKQA
jgi:nickel/cobalt transporter (NiCoT) family protein